MGIAGRLVSAVIVAALVSSPVWAQTALGMTTPPGITFPAPPPPATPPSPPQAPPPSAPSPVGPHHGRGALVTAGDLFLAGPHTYAPRFHRRSHGRVRPILIPYVVPSFPYFPLSDFSWPGMRGAAEPAVTDDQDVRILPNDAPTFPRRPELVESSAGAPPLPFVKPASPKTLYVIPRCYAGDRLPDASQLPAGCRVDDVQVIPTR